MKLIGTIRTAFTIACRRGRSLNSSDKFKTQIDFRVMPWDLHFRVAQTEAFVFFLELGRWDQARQLGVLPAFFRDRCAPYAIMQTLRFCKPLRVFEKFTVESEIVYLDEEYTYIKHAIHRGDTLVCYGLIKYLISGKHGRVSCRKFYGAAGDKFIGAKAPDYIAASDTLANGLFAAI